MPKFRHTHIILVINQIQNTIIYSVVEQVWNYVENVGYNWGKYADLSLAIIHNGNTYLLNPAFPSVFLPDPYATFYLRNSEVCR